MTKIDKVCWYIAVLFVFTLIALVVAEKRIEYLVDKKIENTKIVFIQR